MIRVSDLGKTYGNRELFSGTGFTINPRERIGVLGRNGFGKTTLFRMLLGTEHPDQGEIAFPKNYQVGALPQQIAFSAPTVLDEAALGIGTKAEDELWKAKKLLSGLGFQEADFDRDPAEFSGGYQLRLVLARTLLAEPQLLLLDEPTNFLDIISMRWLERFLNSWPGELMVISHDEAFIDAIAPVKLVIHRRRIRKMKGTTRAVWEQIWNEEAVHDKTRLNQEKEKARQEHFIRTFRAGARSAGLVQSRIKMLDKLQPVERLEQIAQIRFRFPYAEIHKNILLHAHNLFFRYPDMPADLLPGVSLSVYKGDRIGIVGKNGKGKSTLLKLLASAALFDQQCIPDRGTIKCSQNLLAGYFSQTNTETLHPERLITEELRSAAPASTEQEIRTLCGSLLFSGEEALKPIKVLSGGEKSRVLLGKLFLRPHNLLLLDEPTSHLDMETCDALLAAMQAFAGAVVIVSHNEKLLAELTNRLVVFDGGSVTVYEHGYRTFLAERGWQEEETASLAAQKRPGKSGYLERKDRQRELKRLEKAIAQSEKRLATLETKQEEQTAAMTAACLDPDPIAIARLGNSLKLLHEEIASEYNAFDALLTAQDALKADEAEAEKSA